VAIIQGRRPSFDDFEVPPSVSTVFVSAAELDAMMRAPQSVTVLDARGGNSFYAIEDPAWGNSIPGSQRVAWKEFTDTRTGKLLPAERQQQIFQSKGVSMGVPVVVYGAWSSKRSWGEEGRIYWQLDYLGHTNVPPPPLSPPYALRALTTVHDEATLKRGQRKGDEDILVLDFHTAFN